MKKNIITITAILSMSFLLIYALALFEAKMKLNNFVIVFYIPAFQERVFADKEYEFEEKEFKDKKETKKMICNEESGNETIRIQRNPKSYTMCRIRRTPKEYREHYASLINEASRNYDLPNGLLQGVLEAESSFRHDVIIGKKVSSKGAIGIAQFMPNTARELNVNPLNPEQAIDGAAQYLAKLHNRFGSWDLALAAYNAGPDAVANYGRIPPYKETRNFVKKVKVFMN